MERMLKDSLSKTLWYAVNGSGQGCIFTTFPVRDENRKCWVGEMIGYYVSVVMLMESEGFDLPVITWKDSPVRLKISLCHDKED